MIVSILVLPILVALTILAAGLVPEYGPFILSAGMLMAFWLGYAVARRAPW